MEDLLLTAADEEALEGSERLDESDRVQHPALDAHRRAAVETDHGAFAQLSKHLPLRQLELVIVHLKGGDECLMIRVLSHVAQVDESASATNLTDGQRLLQVPRSGGERDLRLEDSACEVWRDQAAVDEPPLLFFPHWLVHDADGLLEFNLRSCRVIQGHAALALLVDRRMSVEEHQISSGFIGPDVASLTPVPRPPDPRLRWDVARGSHRLARRRKKLPVARPLGPPGDIAELRFARERHIVLQLLDLPFDDRLVSCVGGSIAPGSLHLVLRCDGDDRMPDLVAELDALTPISLFDGVHYMQENNIVVLSADHQTSPLGVRTDFLEHVRRPALHA